MPNNSSRGGNSPLKPYFHSTVSRYSVCDIIILVISSPTSASASPFAASESSSIGRRYGFVNEGNNIYTKALLFKQKLILSFLSDFAYNRPEFNFFAELVLILSPQIVSSFKSFDFDKFIEIALMSLAFANLSRDSSYEVLVEDLMGGTGKSF